MWFLAGPKEECVSLKNLQGYRCSANYKPSINELTSFLFEHLLPVITIVSPFIFLPVFHNVFFAEFFCVIKVVPRSRRRFPFFPLFPLNQLGSLATSLKEEEKSPNFSLSPFVRPRKMTTKKSENKIFCRPNTDSALKTLQLGSGRPCNRTAYRPSELGFGWLLLAILFERERLVFPFGSLQKLFLLGGDLRKLG